MPVRIALATCLEHPFLPASERGLIPALRVVGIEAAPVIWDQPDVDWGGFDAVVVRTTWDYVQKAALFGAWLEMLEAEGVTVLNPPDLIRWNMDKRYLAALETAGIAIAPTEWLVRERAHSLDERLAERGWAHGVVKPVVSAGAYRTFRVKRGDEKSQQALEEVLRGSDAMLQPFLPEIESEGEWSLIFLGGEYSHAVLKTAAEGDFRVQEEHGGRYERREPPGPLIRQSQAAIQRAGGPFLYARVDGVRRGDAFLLVELELIEPELFLSYSDQAAPRLARAIAARLMKPAR